MVKFLIGAVILLMIFAAKASYQGRVVAVLIAFGLLYYAYQNKNKF